MEHMGMQQAMDWLKAHSPRIIFLVIVCVAAYVTARLVSRALRKALEKSQIPDASIFVNLARVLIWVIAVTIVLKPVFGVNPMTLFTALGIGGFAVQAAAASGMSNALFSGADLVASATMTIVCGIICLVGTGVCDTLAVRGAGASALVGASAGAAVLAVVGILLLRLAFYTMQISVGLSIM